MSDQLPGYCLFEKHYKRVDVDAKQASSIAGLNYILGSLGFARYLTEQYGKPNIHKSSVHLADYKDRCGIIFYDVRTWSDAYGHIHSSVPSCEGDPREGLTSVILN